MTPIAKDPLISVFKDQLTFIEFNEFGAKRRQVTLVWQRFTKLGISFLIHQYEGHDD